MSAPKSIFITGAASGMGRATALLFAERGWMVGGYDVDGAGLNSLGQEIGDGLFETLDVVDAEAFHATVARFGARTGGTLDLLFNNAGIATGGPIDEQPWDEIARIVQVNLLGVINGVRAGLPLLRATPGSLLLNNSSSSAIFGSAGMSVYSASKHAVRGLTEALATEFKPYGVRAADLLPGLVDTPLLTDDLRAIAPPDGMWRIVPTREIAETVWRAYREDRLHWFVPEELRAFQLDAAAQPERTRDERTALFAMLKSMLNQEAA